MQELVDGHAQDVSVNDGHARDAPVLGARAYALVNLREVRERARDEARRELARALVHLRLAQLLPVGAHKLVGSPRTSDVSRKEHLQGAFARLTS